MCPHVLDAREGYVCTPLRLVAWRARRPAEGEADGEARRTPEVRRAMLNTDDWLLGR